MLNCSQEELLQDFEDSPVIFKSALQTYLLAEFVQFGGKPYGAVISCFAFSAAPQDVKLIAVHVHVSEPFPAPVIAAAAPQMFGVESYEEIARLKDLASIFEGAALCQVELVPRDRGFRYLGLNRAAVSPAHALRFGLDSGESRSIRREERGATDNYLWECGFAFATRLTDSFAQYRWCPNIIGPQSGGTVGPADPHLRVDGATSVENPD